MAGALRLSQGASLTEPDESEGSGCSDRRPGTGLRREPEREREPEKERERERERERESFIRNYGP